ncbi:orotidine-5'-phosphate decarboxylase [Clostridium paridis]|uniref:Orotidine 5'-phosphate decarboxylase n=1 Tax=Clostridium paridis TaxID=2803863 RepID=A0A937K517_9CLOT|nr:orotidine-5'-phosphate decarboxylase [Clostridium paridis]
MLNIIDRLFKRVEEKGVVCVGLDTSIEYVPEYIIKASLDEAEAILKFNKEIIDGTYDVAAVFKVQIAYYEALGIKGLEVYKKTLDYLREKEAIIIADIKRGDIAATAKMYAKAHFEGDFEADFITLSPYMGMDSIEPYLPYLERGKKGLFPLVRTSNPGANDIEFLDTTLGHKVYHEVGDRLTKMGEACLGECGYSQIGGVLGCTHREEAKELRSRFSKMFFLIPGYGAQGGKAEDVALYLNKGNGGVVNSSRKILLAYKEGDGKESLGYYARKEVIRMRDEILDAVNKVG